MLVCVDVCVCVWVCVCACACMRVRMYLRTYVRMYIYIHAPETEPSSPGQGRVTLVSGSVLGHCIFHSASGPDEQPVNSVNIHAVYDFL